MTEFDERVEVTLTLAQVSTLAAAGRTLFDLADKLNTREAEDLRTGIEALEDAVGLGPNTDPEYARQLYRPDERRDPRE